MTIITESTAIQDVFHIKLKAFGDERGRFREIFRKEWFPQRSWQSVQSNHSESRAGVLRGLHFHRHQVDYWYVLRGRIRAGLVDLRASSPTFMKGITIDLGHDLEEGIYIPVGVAHGFFALDDSAILYVVDHYYDGQDEFGVMWNDPDIGLDWGVEAPILSQRDQENPRFSQIPDSILPK